MVIDSTLHRLYAQPIQIDAHGYRQRHLNSYLLASSVREVENREIKVSIGTRHRYFWLFLNSSNETNDTGPWSQHDSEWKRSDNRQSL